MSTRTANPTEASVVRATLDLVWAQWSCILPSLAAPSRVVARSIIDPEALILVSLQLQEHERRLSDVLSGMARAHSKLLSVHRAQALCKHFPASTLALLNEFAVHAKHPSWKRLAADAVTPDAIKTRSKTPGPLRLLAQPAMLLRLRSAFGVGLKADLVTFLIVQRGRSHSARHIAAALGYTERNTRIAADELVGSGLAFRDDYGDAPLYLVDTVAWQALLTSATTTDSIGTDASADWRYWSEVFGFVATVCSHFERARLESWTDYVVESRARDVIDQQYPILLRIGVAERPTAVSERRKPSEQLMRLVENTVNHLRTDLVAQEAYVDAR